MAGPALKIVGICGSLRAASLNMAALRACTGILPEGVQLEIVSLDDIPMYNQDVFDKGIPESVQRLRSAIRQADAVLIATPEYNFSIPAVLKNAIDWCSRAPNQSFQDKPVAIISASTGPLGGARVQYDLRKVLGQLWAMVLPRPEIFIGHASSKFDSLGLADAMTEKYLREFLVAFAGWTRRIRA